MLNPPSPLRDSLTRWLPHAAFVVTYVLLDWISFIEPLRGLNITPWSPDIALGFVYWLRYGKRAAILWFCALLITEGTVRNFPGGVLETTALSVWLIIGYGCIAEALRHSFTINEIFDNRRRLLTWLSIVVIGTLLNATIYISLLYFADLIPKSDWVLAVARYWTGDIVGVSITMPIIWLLASSRGRHRLRSIVARWETAGYVGLMITLLWLVFNFFHTSDFNHFYFLFLPIVWAATRQGLTGATLVAFVLQLGIIGVVKWVPGIHVAIFELQLLSCVLALGCFFIGVVVDEQKQIADELKQTLRLAAAGEMAAALAHELNQPMTALSAYGKACEALLARGDTGDVLKNAIQRMIIESNRAASVVRRLRDFFRTGAMQIESVKVSTIIEAIILPFLDRSQQHGIIFKINPIPEIMVNVDCLQIELVLRNLLDNAFDSVLNQPEGNRHVTLAVNMLDGGRLEISVTDSGSGVPVNLMDSLFEPFASSKSSGMGLGLVLSRTIVEAHGGRLWAEIGDHGLFKFVLPLVKTIKNDA